MSDPLGDAPRRPVVRGPVRFRKRAPRRRLPSLLRRIAAGTLDLMIGLGLSYGLYVLGALRLDRWLELDPGLPWIEHLSVTFYRAPLAALWTLTAVFLPVAFMHIALAVYPGKTLGAWLFRLELVDVDGRAVSPERAMVRGLLYLLWPLTLGWAPLFVAISRKQQGIHDALAGVVVVHRSEKRAREEGTSPTKSG